MGDSAPVGAVPGANALPSLARDKRQLIQGHRGSLKYVATAAPSATELLVTLP
jgi:hypothetical protein